MRSSRRNPTGNFWPSLLQEQLLVSALGDPRAAVTAWRDLQPFFSLDELEVGSFELLPLIYRNLASAEYDDELQPRLKGIYRRTWVNNNLLVERARDASDALNRAGIPALFVEGPTLATRFYGELGLRPTEWIDILVREGTIESAVANLVRAGWLERTELRRGTERRLWDAAGNACLLRTSLAIDFVTSPDPGRSEDPLWAAAEQFAVGQQSVLVPTPTDVLLAVCVSHVRARSYPKVQWIADTKMILRNELDWERLLAIAVTHGQGMRLRDAFRYLSSIPGPRPPVEVCSRLESGHSTTRARLAHKCTAGSARGVRGVAVPIGEHLGATRNESPVRVMTSFPGHLRERWNLVHNWQLPFAMGQRVARHLAWARKNAG